METKSFYVEVLRPEISELLCKIAKDAGLEEFETSDYNDKYFVVSPEEFYTLITKPEQPKISISEAIEYLQQLKEEKEETPDFNKQVAEPINEILNNWYQSHKSD